MRFWKVFLCLFIVIFGGILLTCDNPIGLGPKVNTEYPVISVPDDAGNKPGAFISGEDNWIELELEQEFGIRDAYMTIWYWHDDEKYPDCTIHVPPTEGTHKGKIEMRIPIGEADGVVQLEKIPDTNTYRVRFKIDTKGLHMADGQFTATVTAVDSDNKTTTTTEIVYTVKNTPPQFEMSMPKIAGRDFDVDYEIEKTVNQGVSLIGIAKDISGIAKGTPQIMIWPKNNPDTGDPWVMGVDGILDADDAPASNAREWGTWRTMLDDKDRPLDREGLTAVMASWPTVKLVNTGDEYVLPPDLNVLSFPDDYLDAGDYYIKVRIKDSFEDSAYNIYPYRTDHAFKEGEIPENNNERYITITLTSSDTPTITILENPEYYNREGDFTALVEVTGASMLGFTVEAIINDNKTVNFANPGSGAKGPFNLSNISGNNYKLEVPNNQMPEIPDPPKSKKLYLHIKAVNKETGSWSISNKNFEFDVVKPNINFIEPQNLRAIKPELTSTVNFRGNVEDDNQVEKMWYQLGVTDICSDPNHVDCDCGTWIDTERDIRSDTVRKYPYPGGAIDAVWSGSLSSWTLKFNDIIDLYYAPTKADFIAGGNYFLKPNDTTSETANANLWILPIKFKVMDSAGNVHIETVEVIVDPDADLAKVTITSHVPVEGKDSVVGGQVRLTGNAIDNEWVHSVFIRVSKLDEYGQNPEIVTDGFEGWQVNNGIIVSQIPSSNGKGWQEVSYSSPNKSMSINWWYNLNGMGELNPTGGTEEQLVLVELHAIDAYLYDTVVMKTPGRTTSRQFIFSTNVPVITDMKVYRGDNILALMDDWEYGIKVSDKIIFRTTIQANNIIDKVEWSGTGDPLVQLTNETAGDYSLPWIDRKGSATEWDVYVPIDTKTIRNNRFASTAGDHSINLQVYDKADPPNRTLNSYLFAIDNFFPLGSFDGNLHAFGSNYEIGGVAWDINTGINVAEIDFVAVYFSRPNGADWRDGTPISLWGGIDPTFETGNFIDAYFINSRKAKVGRKGTEQKISVEGNEETLPFFPKLNVTKNAGKEILGSTMAAIVINTTGKYDAAQKPSGVTDFYGYSQSFIGANPGRKDWSVQFNTNQLKDGPVDLHYVVFDTAGNATHNVKRIYIANNRPRITSISLGTDLDRYDGITHFEYTNYPVTGLSILYDAAGYNPANGLSIIYGETGNRTNFRIRNNRFGVNVTTSNVSGNGNKTAVVYYAAAGNAVSVTNMAKGGVYTIVTAGSVKWANYGVYDNLNNPVGTTFVAARDYIPGDDASARVIPYTLTEDRTGSFGSGAHTTPAPILYGDGNTWPAAITESGNTVNSEGNVILRYNRYFAIRVYDTTISGGARDDQLSDIVLVNLDVNNEDTIPPIVKIKPFYWNTIFDNSIYLSANVNVTTRNLNGHIELPEDLPAAFNQASGIADRDPKVSGQISISGTATDNNVINYIYFRIHDNGATVDFDTAYTGNDNINGVSIPRRLTHEGNVYYRAATFNNGMWTFTDRFANNGWKFTVPNSSARPNLPGMGGHDIDWQLDFDTSFINASHVAPDQSVQVIALDYAAVVASTADNTGRGLSGSYRMDIVPYISAIETSNRTEGGLKNNNIRSANGRYSVRQGNTNDFITVRGFNLRPSANGIRILNSTQNEIHKDTPYTVPGTNIAGAVQTGTIAKDGTGFRITNNLSSGYLVVIGANNIFSLNNINNNNALGSYKLKTSTDDPKGLVYKQKENISNGSDEENMSNREADRYNTKNITLTDDRYLQFFTVIKTNVRNGYNPVMMMEGDNPVFGYVDLTGGSSGNATIGANTNAGNFYPSHAQPQRSRFNIATGAREDTEYLIKANIWDGMGMTRDESGRYLHATTYNRDGAHFHLIYDRYAELHQTNASGTTSGGTQNYGTAWGAGTTYTDYRGVMAWDTNNNAIPLERNNVAPGLMLDRFVYPKLIAKGNSITSFANYYMSYFDNASNEIIFRNFRIGLTGQTGETNNRLYDGTIQDQNNRAYQAYTNLTTTNDSSISVLNRNVAANNASSHFAMAVDSGNRAVIAYYNEGMGRLVIQYTAALDGSNTNNTNITWTQSQASAAMPDYVGMYVSMAIDAYDRLHIAAFNALDSTLKYIFINNFRAASTTAAGVVQVTVDQYGSVGHWTDIKILDGVPYIAYYNATETGGRDAIKMATAKNMVTSATDVKGGVDKNGYTTGNWEYRTVPAIDPPQGGSLKFQKVNLDFTTNNRPVLGYLGANLEFSYPVLE